MMNNIIYKILLITVLTSIYGDAMELIGKIKVKGNMPHTYLTIEENNSNKSYNIENANEFNLTSMQNEIVTLKVKLLKQSIGPGFPAVIKVLKIK